jgi:hypothetical protein
MKAQLLKITGFFLIVCGVASTAQATQWIKDSYGMPRCVVEKNQVHSFHWNLDPYQRRILVRSFSIFERQQMMPPDGSRVIYMRLFDAYCVPTQPRDYIGGMWKAQASWNLAKGSAWLSLDDDNVLGLETPEEIRQAFFQVSLGGNVYRDLSAQEMWRRLAKPSYTTELNILLTKNFGVGFSAAVYRASVESKKANIEFKNELAQRISLNEKKASFSRDLPFTAVIVKGFGYSLTNNRLFRDLVTDLQNQIGIEVVDLETKSFGTPAENAELVRVELDRLLAQGKDLVIIAGCVGASEALAAMAALRADIEGPSRRPNYGRVLAFTGLSPMIAGSFIADWATSFPQSYFVTKSLHSRFKEMDPSVPARSDLARSLKSLSEGSLKAAIEALGEKLPRSTIYFSLIGAKTGDGLAEDTNLRGMQDEMVRRIIFKRDDFASNDGFIRYPGSAIPDQWPVEQYAVVAEASHALLDGEYDGYSLKPGLRDRVVVIRSILEILYEKSQHKNFN